MNLIDELIINKDNVSKVESRIENGVIHQITREKNILTKDFIFNMMNKINTDNGILPINCRYSLPVADNATLLVIEESPVIRPVKFNVDLENELDIIDKSGQGDLNVKRFIEGKSKPYTLYLSFPYIVYIIMVYDHSDRYRLENFRVFFRNHKIKNLNDYLYIANLYNLDDLNDTCFGSTDPYTKEKYPDLISVCEHFINNYWIKPFTYEYTTRHHKYLGNSYLHTYLTWAHYSKTDPYFVYNANWIMNDGNLQREINLVRGNSNSSDSSTFHKLFLSSMDRITFIDNAKKYSYENININGKVLSLDDEIVYEDKNYFVYEIFGNVDGPTHIILIDDENNKTDEIELTNYLKHNISEQINNILNNYKDNIEIDGKLVKKGSMVKFIPSNSYNTIEKIRQSRDGKIEFILSDGKFYVVNKDNFEIIDSVKVNNYENINININGKYIIYNNENQTFFIGQLETLETINNSLKLYFRNIDNDVRVDIEIEAIECNDVLIDNIENIEQTPSVFRYLDKLYTNYDNLYIIAKNKEIYSKLQSGENNRLFPIIYNNENIINNILIENNKTLFIKGIDKDLNFTIGDNVIVCDWENSDLMFNIRTISEFIISDDNILQFKLIDSLKKEILIDYINLENGKIRVGHIRKVTDELNGIPYGSIVKSNTNNFTNFPKKDNNIISSFIIDCERPLVLFNNGLTLWIDDLENNFDILLPNSDEFNRIKKTKEFNIDDIKWQTGDLCIRDGKLYVINMDNAYLGILYMGIDPDFVKTANLQGRGLANTEIDSEFKRYGLIDPRYKKNECEIEGEVIPDFHNGYTPVSTEGFYLYSKQIRNSEVN